MKKLFLLAFICLSVLFVCFAPSFVFADLSTGLLVHYDFDSDNNAVGGTVVDQSGNGNNGIVQGSPGKVNGIIGDAFDLSSGDYILAATNPLAGVSSFSISLWFKTANPSNNYKLASGAYWYGGNNASGWNIGTHYPEGWADSYGGTIRGAPGWTRSVNFVAGQWNHHVVIYSGTTIKEYINGELAVDLPGTGVVLGIGCPLEVGAWSQAGFYYTGLIDEFRAYNRALCNDEVIALFNESVPVASTFDELVENAATLCYEEFLLPTYPDGLRASWGGVYSSYQPTHPDDDWYNPHYVISESTTLLAQVAVARDDEQTLAEMIDLLLDPSFHSSNRFQLFQWVL
ncbi:MAG: LamG domain-containing protein, partial [Candidatus Theseobacter exili]|nr:LamG domain-containing protein [Candidatus Theseobacter exili]